MVSFWFGVFPSPRGIETFLRSRSGLRSVTLKVNSVDERPALSLQAWPESTNEPFQDRPLPHGTFVPGGLLAARSSRELTLRAESASFMKPSASLTFRWSLAFGVSRSVDDGNEEVGTSKSAPRSLSEAMNHLPTGSLTAQLAVRFPVPASARPLPYSP
jgi:hypothetical protein